MMVSSHLLTDLKLKPLALPELEFSNLKHVNMFCGKRPNMGPYFSEIFRSVKDHHAMDGSFTLRVIENPETGLHHSELDYMWNTEVLPYLPFQQFFIWTQSYELLVSLCKTVDLNQISFYRVEQVQSEPKVIYCDGPLLASVLEHGWEMR